MQHASPVIQVFMLTLAAVLLFHILRARSGRQLFIRRIPGLNAIDEAVGRATEMGRPLFFSTGLDGLTVTTLQALSIANHVMRMAARFNTRVVIPVRDTIVYPVVEEMAREAYTAEGKPELFNAEDIRFLSNQQFAYASGCVGIMNREQVAANFFFGSFYAESLILSEAGREIGAIQVAGTPSTTQIPFLIASCDYTIIGEEYFAATAYLSREPILMGSLVGQDRGKIILFLFIMVGILLTSVGLTDLVATLQSQLGMPGVAS